LEPQIAHEQERGHDATLGSTRVIGRFGLLLRIWRIVHDLRGLAPGLAAHRSPQHLEQDWPMSVRTMARVWECSSHSGAELLMLVAIADFADDEGRAYPSISTLATKCRTKPRYAMVLLEALRRSGELEVHKNAGAVGQGGRTNLYRIALDRLSGSAEVVNPSAQLYSGEVVNQGAHLSGEVVNQGASLAMDGVAHPGAPLEAQAVNPGAVVNQSAVVHQGSGSSEPGFREVVNQGAPKPSMNRQEPPSLARSRAQTQTRKGPERIKTEHALFAEFYAAYPRKVAKPAALKAFNTLDPDRDTLKAMLAAIAAQGLADRCAAGEDRYVPHPATWLNGRRWEDQPAAARRADQRGRIADAARFKPSDYEVGATVGADHA